MRLPVTIFFFTICLVSEMIASVESLKEFEKIWEIRTQDKKAQEEFSGWWGNENAISRILLRLYILQKKYNSVLDVGCGFCKDYESFKRNLVVYSAVDISSTFVSCAKEKGIDVTQARVQKMPYEDSSIECVYCRHLLEHLNNYQDAIREMVRVASKEVIVVFFNAPDISASNDKSSIINVGGFSTYQNKYCRSKIEAFLQTLQKVKSYSWQEVKNKEEIILHIIVE